jgi:uncharacterized phage protein (TIGR02220 family)
MNFYKRYMGDYMRDTVHLSMAEDGAYTRLMDYYYSTEKPLPADKKIVYRIARATEKAEQKAVDSVLEQFFDLESDGWHQYRIDEEIEKSKPKTEANQANGKKGGRPRKEPKENPPENPMGFEIETQDEPTEKPALVNHSHSHKKQNSKALSGKPDAIAVLDYLNERTGRSYQPVDSNTKLIAGRLKDGATVEQCKAVIDAKVAKWGADPKMDEYLRPKTLFNATNYAQYSGELGAQKIAANSGGNDRPVDPRFRGCK